MAAWVNSETSGGRAVRGADQTWRPDRGPVRLSLLLTIILMGTGLLTAGALADPPDQTATIVMAADRIRHWDADGDRWVWLDGHAEVSQGTAGVRAACALVRIRPVADSLEQPVAAVEVFASGQARSLEAPPEAPAAESLRLALATASRPTLRALTAGGVHPLDGPPRGLPLLAQGFPDAVPAPARPAEPAIAAGQTPATDPAGATPSSAEPAAASDPQPAIPTLEAAVDQDTRPAQFAEDGAGMLAPGTLQGGTTGDEFNMPDADLGAPAQDELQPLPPPTDAVPLPEGEVPDPTVPSTVLPPAGGPIVEGEIGPAPILPGTRRTWTITPRYGGRRPIFESPQRGPDGSMIFTVRGGLIIVSEIPGRGRVDLAADNVVIWTRPKADGPGATPALGMPISQDADQPLEAYLEGDVMIRLDELKLAGPNDQRSFRGEQVYFDFRSERVLALNAEFNFYTPGLIAPIKTKGALINQYRPEFVDPQGRLSLGPARISAERTTSTGSRFPKPGYRFDARSVDITQIEEPLTDPFSGAAIRGPDGQPAKDTTWLIDSRQNAYYIGPVPFFYWPRIRTTDDLDPPLRNFSYRYGNYFGNQFLLDLSPFKLLGLKKPTWIDTWNLDVDYLSMRGPALGTEAGWFGNDLIGNLTDPYGRGTGRNVDQPYFGYIDLWGIYDKGVDVLGSGPAIVTYGPPGAGKRGYQRDRVPSFKEWRGRFLVRHMQSLLGPDAEDTDDFRLQIEAASYTDRQFLEQYYKRLFDSGLDQDTKAYMIYQTRNRATTITAQANLMPWITDTQMLPKAEYYRLGDSLFSNLFSYSQNWGVNYANVHTAVEVNNPNIFAFLPYDPISNTSGPFSAGRAWTTHQLEMPLSLGFMRLVPYAQGQVMGWTNQLDNQSQGRAWGAGGLRANMMAWRTFNDADSELLNIHGLAHKVNFNVDFRTAYSTVGLEQLGIQDQYDDDTYELTRRYFALTNYVGGLLPQQYDPRFLMLRRAVDPVVFTPDLQSDLMTVKFGLHQRLQTKRGPEGRRRIVDYMILDLQTIYYPNASRDNFGKPFGQNMYNYEWFIGDRTSIVSTGWFEFWDIAGDPILVTNPRKTNDPFGLQVITAGMNINRPPRGSVYFGYSIINTGTIQTSALNVAYNYWMSPKWYTSFATSYDFGNAILLGSTVSITKVGADFLTSVGLSVDPQRQNYTFGFEIAPRFSPNVRLGQAVGTRFDSRFAPTQ